MRLMLTAVMCLAMAACSKSTPSSAPATTATDAPAPASPATSQTGLVSGTTSAGAIVVLEPKPPRELPPSDPAAMDQVSLTFTPPMLFARTGQPVEFRNSDDTLHNVHVGNADTREPAFNVAIPTGQKYAYTFVKDGFYHVGCDIHPAMAADILSMSTPFVTTAGEDGGFSFADVPAGTYVVRTYSGGVKAERDVEIKGGKNEIGKLVS